MDKKTKIILGSIISVVVICLVAAGVAVFMLLQNPKKINNDTASSSNSNVAMLEGPFNIYDKNVKNYGAVGDGVADDTKAIQAAIDATVNSTVYFPMGKYRITKPIMLKKFMSVIGEPLDSGVGGPEIIADANMDVIFDTSLESANRVHIQNFTIDGGKTRGREVKWAIELNDALDSKVSNIEIKNVTGGGIDVPEWKKAASTAWIEWINFYENLKISNVGDYAIKVRTSDSYINNVTVDGGKGILDFMHSGNKYYNILVENSTGAGLTIGRPEVNETRDVVVSNCTFRNNATYGIQAKRTAVMLKELLVENCEFENNKVADVSVENALNVAFYLCNFKSQAAVEGTESSNAIAFTECEFKAANLPKLGSAVTQYKCKFSANQFTKRGTETVIAYYKYIDETNKIIGDKFKTPKFVNIKDYMKTNSIALPNVALQKIVDEMPNGGVIYFPTGRYLFASSVKITSNIKILGGGYANTVFEPSAQIDQIFLIDNKAKNVGLINFQIQNPKNVSVDSFVRIEDSSDIYLDKISISQINQNSNVKRFFTIGKEASKVAINGCVTISNDFALNQYYVKGRDCVFQNSYINRGGVGILFEDGGGHVVYNCHTDYYASTAIKFVNTEGKPFDTKIFCMYMDLNTKCFSFESQSKFDANVSISTCVFREGGFSQESRDLQSGIPPKGTPKFETEIVIQNAQNISFIAMDFPTENVFTFNKNVDNIKIIGNVGGKPIVPGSGDYGKNSVVEANAVYVQ